MKTRNRNSLLFSVVTSGIGLNSAFRDLRAARTNGDRLALLDAAASLFAVLTGLAMAYRTLRQDD